MLSRSNFITNFIEGVVKFNAESFNEHFDQSQYFCPKL